MKKFQKPRTNDKNFPSCVGNDESYFCAKSSSDYGKAQQTMMPLSQKILATSETVTIKVGIDLDGTVVRIDGTMDPKTIPNALSKNGILLDFEQNDKIDQASIILGTFFFWYLLVIYFPIFINNFLPND